MFHSHVDTPRGAMQFGSLVCLLPCRHEGKPSCFFIPRLHNRINTWIRHRVKAAMGPLELSLVMGEDIYR